MITMIEAGYGNF